MTYLVSNLRGTRCLTKTFSFNVNTASSVIVVLSVIVVFYCVTNCVCVCVCVCVVFFTECNCNVSCFMLLRDLPCQHYITGHNWTFGMAFRLPLALNKSITRNA